MRKNNREFLLKLNHKECAEKFWDKIINICSI